jgi:hypothetical protein
MRGFKIMPMIALSAAMVVPAATPAAAQHKMVTLPAGSSIMVRMLDSVDSSKNQPGSRFAATLETNLTVDGAVAVPQGSTVYGRLAQATQAGNATGSSELRLELTDIVVGGTSYPILTSDYQVKGKSSGKRSAKRLIGGTGLGAIIGGIAGNAGMGAAIGATAGAVGAIAQKGQKVQVPSETLIEFRLAQPAPVPAR